MVEAADVITMLDIAADGKVLFATDGADLDGDNQYDVWNLLLAKADGTGKCTVTPDSVAISGSLTSPGTGVAWPEVTIDTSGSVTNVTGRLTTLADCITHTFGEAISGFADATTGLLYGENYNADAAIADLSYALFAAAGTVNPKMQIQKEADVSFETLFPEQPRVLFSLNGRAVGNGVYISPMLTGTPTTALLAPAPITFAGTTTAGFAGHPAGTFGKNTGERDEVDEHAADV